jgi:hypothetical protein
LVNTGDCTAVPDLLREFDERVAVIVSVLTSKSLQVEQEYFQVRKEGVREIGEKVKRITNWGSRAEERVCFNKVKLV